MHKQFIYFKVPKWVLLLSANKLPFWYKCENQDRPSTTTSVKEVLVL